MPVARLVHVWLGILALLVGFFGPFLPIVFLEFGPGFPPLEDSTILFSIHKRGPWCCRRRRLLLLQGWVGYCRISPKVSQSSEYRSSSASNPGSGVERLGRSLHDRGPHLTAVGGWDSLCHHWLLRPSRSRSHHVTLPTGEILKGSCWSRWQRTTRKGWSRSVSISHHHKAIGVQKLGFQLRYRLGFPDKHRKT